MPRGGATAAAAVARALGCLLARGAGAGMSRLPNAQANGRERPPGGVQPLLEVRGLKKQFPIIKGLFSRVSGAVRAVDGVSFQIGAGETLGLVGESGCGKSTVGRTMLKLLEPSAGSIHVDGTDITGLDSQGMLPYRKRLQMIYQDPYASLNPRMSAGQIVGEPLLIHGVGQPPERRERVAFLFHRVGLRPEAMHAFPHEFSGGQRQRIGIARALALNPDLIVGDEPVSALDVSIQAQIINLLMDLQDEYKLSYIFIAHNMSVVEHISDRVAVMYLGKIVEVAPSKALYAAPRHPYTEALLSAVPVPDPTAEKQRIILEGDVPSPINPPTGCRFHPRCRYKQDICAAQSPELREWAPDHFVACHFPLGLPGPARAPA